MENALSDEWLPLLGIETDYSQGDIQQIRTRFDAFLEMINDR